MQEQIAAQSDLSRLMTTHSEDKSDTADRFANFFNIRADGKLKGGVMPLRIRSMARRIAIVEGPLPFAVLA
ncbi:hypothetical protein [Paraburkholderia antibiotica]|uniref:Uncharacterized protein n=1 Tax=Paraburkholderia antibiotica TaxID=2728839 RepID=A0A7Y0A1M7_9BURK|nr:hypothetical protein [Paraburkholderia antibiotica]NML34866.1 hypothetical protein [Paraburkholderia antibiotica]